MRPWIPFGIAACGLLLIGLIAAEALSGSARLAHIEAPAQQAQAPSLAATVNAEADPTQVVPVLVRTVLARPLMAANRQPAAAAAGGISLTGGLPRLAGVMAGPGGNVAIFARDESGHPIFAHEGASLGAYRVQSIVPGTVTLLGPSGTQILHPRFGAPATAPEPSPPPLILPGMQQVPFPSPPMNFPNQAVPQ